MTKQKRPMRMRKPSIAFTLTFLFLSIASSNVSAQRMITYDTALEIAMENSPDIKQTRLQLERSRELLNAQNASLKSQFSLSLNPFSYSRDRTFNRMFSAWNTTETQESDGTFTVRQPIKQTDGTLSLINSFSWQDSYSDYLDVTTKSYSNNIYLNYDQPIFTYNRTKLELKELELDLETTSLTYSLQKLSLEQQVANAFYSVYQNKMNLEVTKDEFENQQKSHDIIKNKVDAGLAALEELYQAELNLSTSRSNVQNQEVQLENALDDLKLMIGIPLSEQIYVESDVQFELVEVDLDKAIETALANRLELRNSEIDIENAQFDLIRTKAENEFEGSISLNYGLIGTEETIGDIYTDPTQKQGVGLSFTIPLWDWGEKKSRVMASQATIKRQKLSLEDEQNNIEIEIRKSYRSLNNYVTQIEIAEQSVKNAQLTYEINLERYENGDLTSMDLSLYQEQLSEVKISLVQALINYKLALLAMKIESLWDFEKKEPVLITSYAAES